MRVTAVLFNCCTQVEGLQELLKNAGPATGRMALDNVQVGLQPRARQLP